MALIELNADWEKREFGVFCFVNDAPGSMSNAERLEAEALRREKLDEWHRRPVDDRGSARNREAG